MVKKPNYFTVPAAIRELEKIEMTRQLDKIYRLDHTVSKTQKVVLSAFVISAEQVKSKMEIPCFAWNSQAEQGVYFFSEISAFLLSINNNPFS